MIEPETITFDSGYGEVHRLAPMVKLSRTPGKWQDPLLTVRGSDLPGLEGRAVSVAGPGWRGAVAAGLLAVAGQSALAQDTDLETPSDPDEGQYPLLLDGTLSGDGDLKEDEAPHSGWLRFPDAHGAVGAVQGRRPREDRHHLRRLLGRALPELLRRAVLAPSGMPWGRSSP